MAASFSCDELDSRRLPPRTPKQNGARTLAEVLFRIGVMGMAGQAGVVQPGHAVAARAIPPAPAHARVALRRSVQGLHPAGTGAAKGIMVRGIASHSYGCAGCSKGCPGARELRRIPVVLGLAGAVIGPFFGLIGQGKLRCPRWPADVYAVAAEKLGVE